MNKKLTTASGFLSLLGGVFLACGYWVFKSTAVFEFGLYTLLVAALIFFLPPFLRSVCIVFSHCLESLKNIEIGKMDRKIKEAMFMEEVAALKICDIPILIKKGNSSFSVSSSESGSNRGDDAVEFVEYMLQFPCGLKKVSTKEEGEIERTFGSWLYMRGPLDLEGRLGKSMQCISFGKNDIRCSNLTKSVSGLCRYHNGKGVDTVFNSEIVPSCERSFYTTVYIYDDDSREVKVDKSGWL